MRNGTSLFVLLLVVGGCSRPSRTAPQPTTSTVIQVGAVAHSESTRAEIQRLVREAIELNRRCDELADIKDPRLLADFAANKASPSPPPYKSPRLLKTGARELHWSGVGLNTAGTIAMMEVSSWPAQLEPGAPNCCASGSVYTLLLQQDGSWCITWEALWLE